MNSTRAKTISWAIAGIFVFILIASKIYNYFERENALKDTVVVVAEIRSFERTRGATNVNVEYVYNGKTIDNSFGTYNVDSLKIGIKIRLLVSKQHPTEYIKYIGIENQ